MGTGSFELSKGSSLLAQCLKALREREPELRARGILHAGVFGSVARGDDDEKSDIDIVVDVQRGAGLGVLGLVRLRNEFARDFGRSVDIVSKDALKSPKHDRILVDIVSAF